MAALAQVAFLFQVALGGSAPAPAPAPVGFDTTRARIDPWWEPRVVPVRTSSLQYLRFDELTMRRAPADTVKRQRPKAVQLSDAYYTRLGIHKALSWAMIPLFLGSGYTGFVLRSQTTNAPEWVRKLHGPLAGATAVVFGANTLTGMLNLIEGRKDPVNRTKRILHSTLFLAAAGGFAYVIAAGDNIHELGKANHWHRDVALMSMGVSVFSWGLMVF